jgi:hypothetical protein
MQATFVELPPFERARRNYLDDEAYRLLQCELMENPTAGAVIEGTGGLRKLRQTDPRRGKGKRGGLTPAQRKVLKQLLKIELENRQLKDGERNDQ